MTLHPLEMIAGEIDESFFENLSEEKPSTELDLEDSPELYMETRIGNYSLIIQKSEAMILGKPQQYYILTLHELENFQNNPCERNRLALKSYNGFKEAICEYKKAENKLNCLI